MDEVITITPGQENQLLCTDICVVNDDLCEATEAFNVEVEGVGGGTMVVNSPATAFVQDGDGTASIDR